MKANIKVEEIVCLKVVNSNGEGSAIPLKPVFNPNENSPFSVFTDERGDIAIIQHHQSGEFIALDNKGLIIDENTFFNMQ